MIGYAKLAGGLVVLAGLAWLGFIVNGWRKDAAEKPVLIEQRDLALAERDAQAAAVKLAAKAAGEAEVRVAEVAAQKRKVQVVYREAVRDDPTCAAWASQPIACPLGGLPVNASAPAVERMP